MTIQQADVEAHERPRNRKVAGTPPLTPAAGAAEKIFVRVLREKVAEEGEQAVLARLAEFGLGKGAARSLIEGRRRPHFGLGLVILADAGPDVLNEVFACFGYSGVTPLTGDAPSPAELLVELMQFAVVLASWLRDDQPLGHRKTEVIEATREIARQLAEFAAALDAHPPGASLSAHQKPSPLRFHA